MVRAGPWAKVARREEVERGAMELQEWRALRARVAWEASAAWEVLREALVLEPRVDQVVPPEAGPEERPVGREASTVE